MSRVVVLGLDHKSLGEFDAICTLGYSLCGNAAVSPGGSFVIEIPEAIYTGDLLDFGRLVLVQPEDLPPYVGMVDTPWNAKKPVSMTVYDIEALLATRSPDANRKLTGSVDTIIGEILNLFNAQEDAFFRLGNVGAINTVYREETLDTRTFWEQLQALTLRAATEMVLRPERDPNGRWLIYADLASRMGVDTDFLLADGQDGNMTINSAQVRGEIKNRMIGIGSQSSQQSLLTTEPVSDDASRGRYRTRSEVVQFRNVTNLTTLTQNTQNALDAVSEPYLELQVSVTNKEHAFRNLRLGNVVMTHASEVVLQRGVLGWRGKMRIVKMSYNEASHSVGMTLTGRLYK